MRQGQNSKRSRSKGGNRGANGGRHPLNRSFESNGPGGKVRGNPHQVYEKYLSMARDYQAEDPVMAENLLQHADHYFRLIQEANGGKSRRGDGEDKAGAQNEDQKGGGQDESAQSEDQTSGDQDDAAQDSDNQQAGAAAETADNAGEEASASEDGGNTGGKRGRRSRKSKSDDKSDTDATASDAA